MDESFVDQLGEELGLFNLLGITKDADSTGSGASSSKPGTFLQLLFGDDYDNVVSAGEEFSSRDVTSLETSSLDLVSEEDSAQNLSVADLCASGEALNEILATPPMPSFEPGELKDEMLSAFQKVHSLLPKIQKVIIDSVNYLTSPEAEGLESTNLRQRRRRKRRQYNKTCYQLPAHLQTTSTQVYKLIGEGKLKEAHSLAMTILKEACNNPDVYRTVCFIYNEMGERRKALQFQTVATFMDCSDPHTWRELGLRWKDYNDNELACRCLSRACSLCEPDMRAILAYEYGCIRFSYKQLFFATRLFADAVQYSYPVDRAHYLSTVKDLVKLSFSHGLSSRSCRLLDAIFFDYPRLLDFEAINHLTELHITDKNYSRVYEVITSSCGISFPDTSETLTHPPEGSRLAVESSHVAADPSENRILSVTEIDAAFSELKLMVERSALCSDSSDINSPAPKGFELNREGILPMLDPLSQSSVTMPTLKIGDTDQVDPSIGCGQAINLPPNIPVGILAKLGKVMLHLRKHTALVEEVLKPVYAMNLEQSGDIQLDLADTFMQTGHYNRAANILNRLKDLPRLDMPSLWLKLAECYSKIGLPTSAESLLLHIISVAPHLANVHEQLCDLYYTTGQGSMAIKVIREFKDASQKAGRMHESLPQTLALWWQRTETAALAGNAADLAVSGFIFYFTCFSYPGSIKEASVWKESIWTRLLEVVKVLVAREEAALCQELLQVIDDSSRFDNRRHPHVDFICIRLTSFYIFKNYRAAYSICRRLIFRLKKVPTSLWNLLHKIVVGMKDRKSLRFILRMICKYPDSVELMMMNGHFAHISRSYKSAIGEYFYALRMQPYHPVIVLCLAVSHLMLALVRGNRKTRLIQQSLMLFHRYYEMCGGDQSQEACYNLGRAFHQLALFNMAVVYYQKALAFPSSNPKSECGPQYDDLRDLHREAAFNLHLIYKNSGNYVLANSVLRSYCWV